VNKFKAYQKAKSHEIYVPKEGSPKLEESIIKLGGSSCTDLYEDVKRSISLLDTDTQESAIYAEHSFEQLEYYSLEEVTENDKGQVLYVKGFPQLQTSPTNIYNLFSNFGNITKILYFKDSGSALVEFETNLEAATAKFYVEQLNVHENKPQVSFSIHHTIQYTTKPKNVEVFIGSRKTNRFRNGFALEIFNPPSQILHVSNLVPEACNEKLLDLFLAYGRVENYQFLHELPNKNMVLIRYSSLDEAIEAMVQLHGYSIMGRNMLLSFTRSKI
jgi:RNA recognition motif-containing protein